LRRKNISKESFIENRNSGVDRVFGRPGRVITMAAPNRNYILKNLQLFIGFPYNWLNWNFLITKRFSLKSLFCCFWDSAAQGDCTTSLLPSPPPYDALEQKRILFLQNFRKSILICNIEAKINESATANSMLIFSKFLLMVLKYGVNYYFFEAIRTKYEICIKNLDEDSVNCNCQLAFVSYFLLERSSSKK
jgi:hypothetical protein